MAKVEMKVRLTFLEDILGTANADPEIHAEYIASKASDAPSKQEEIDAIGVDESIQKAMTVFPRDEEGQPIFWDYQIKGFFKDTCKMLSKVSDTESAKVTTYKQIIDGLIFIKERKIPIHCSGEIGTCQRPLRAQTMQGERIALANSESIPAGSWVEFTIMSLTEKNTSKTKGTYQFRELFTEWLDYGRLRGVGQWRNSGKGRFEWEEIS